jgi:tetratricopeptide (TPR) repeat protein
VRRFAAALGVLAACSTPAPSPAPRPAIETARAQVGPQPVLPRRNPQVLLSRARASRAEGDVTAARALLEEALEGSGLDDARIELADLLVVDGAELARAEALLAGVADRVATRLHLVLARLAEARGDDAGAEAEYAIVLAATDDPDLRLRRAFALERLGRAGEAIAELELVRAARADDAVARSHLAERYEGAGRLPEAEAEYRWLADAQPERAAEWDRLARFYERAGRLRDARAAADRARVAAGHQERTLRPLLPSKR